MPLIIYIPQTEELLLLYYLTWVEGVDLLNRFSGLGIHQTGFTHRIPLVTGVSVLKDHVNHLDSKQLVSSLILSSLVIDAYFRLHQSYKVSDVHRS